VAISLRTKHTYEFGAYQLDTEEKVLVREGQPVALPPKDLETLVVLVESAGHIVGKEELLEKVWPGVFIEENNLARRVFNLRQVLGEGPDGRKYIETVPKRGYRFVGSVRQLGYSAESTAPPLQSSDSPQSTLRTSRRRTLWPWALAAVLIVAASVLAQRFWRARNHSPDRVMLAVLPFENLSGDANEDYFADGLTEEMIAQLGQVQPSRLGVIARTSIVHYKHTNESIAQIGRELGVGYVMEGSVRRAGGRVRITAQLIQAGPQTHVWAETYEQPLDDVLTIQREIAQKVTDSLSIELLPATTRPDENAHLNIESYDKYLLGLHELGQGTRESINKAMQYFQEGIAIDPKDAHLYSALAEAYESATTYYKSPAEVMPLAKQAAQRAIELDPQLPSAHVKLGDAYLFFDWDWTGAQKEYRHALEINPSLPEAQLGYANYLGTLGRFDEALSRVQQAYLHDPLAVESRNEALWIYYFSGRMPETIDQCRKTIELEPAAGIPYAILSMAYAQMGNHAATLRAADDAVRVGNSPSGLATTAAALAQVSEKAKANQVLTMALNEAKDHYICSFIVAAAYTELGEKEKAIESLQKAFLQRST
jgi:TolB-like protein/DNA-binding winged helix-turn-helix (wHTH) protein/cytochrome c-type biogenesis protein CcmH/NrfG